MQREQQWHDDILIFFAVLKELKITLSPSSFVMGDNKPLLAYACILQRKR